MRLYQKIRSFQSKKLRLKRVRILRTAELLPRRSFFVRLKSVYTAVWRGVTELITDTAHWKICAGFMGNLGCVLLIQHVLTTSEAELFFVLRVVLMLICPLCSPASFTHFAVGLHLYEVLMYVDWIVSFLSCGVQIFSAVLGGFLLKCRCFISLCSQIS